MQNIIWNNMCYVWEEYRRTRWFNGFSSARALDTAPVVLSDATVEWTLVVGGIPRPPTPSWNTSGHGCHQKGAHPATSWPNVGVSPRRYIWKASRFLCYTESVYYHASACYSWCVAYYILSRCLPSGEPFNFHPFVAIYCTFLYIIWLIKKLPDVSFIMNF